MTLSERLLGTVFLALTEVLSDHEGHIEETLGAKTIRRDSPRLGKLNGTWIDNVAGMLQPV